MQSRSRTDGIVLSISCSGTKNDVESAKGSRADGPTYKDAGVDIDAGSELVKRIAKMVPGIGGFCGLFLLGITNFIHLQLIIAYEYASVGGVILEVFLILF